MKIVIQRVYDCKCEVEGELVSKINQGLLCYIGVANEDDEAIAKKVVDKIIGLRVFEDENGKMNLSAKDLGHELMFVSQFTLFGELSKGFRPSFSTSGNPDHAKKMWEFMVNYANETIPCKAGVFAADMKITYTNDGPITLNYEVK